MRTTLVAVTLLLLLSPFLSAQDLPEDAASLPISHLLSLASQALINGKSTSALSIYDHCLERDPSDFATLYKRATLRLATGQFGKAREGFAEVLRVREFDQAHWQLAKLNAKVGEFEEAIREVDVFIKGRKVKEGVEWEEAIELRAQVVKAQLDLVAAEAALASGQLQPCLDHSTSALLTSPNSERLRLVRAECYFLSGDYDSNIGDLSRAAALSPALPPYLLLRISLLSAFFLDNGMEIPTDSLQSIKRCLSSDPDSKGCRSAFKAFKALEKELAKLRNWVEGGRWTEAAVILAGSSNSDGVIHTVKTLLATYQLPLPSSPNSPAPLIASNKLDHASPLLNSLLSTLCRAYISLGQTKKSGMACEAILERRPDDIWGLVGKGERLSAEENWEEAVRVLNDAFEASGKSDRDILGRLQKAQRLLKQSTAKDYYKVLGVARDADKKTIKRAYRKATLKNHPDKAGGSESKMASVNEAYEVLSNPELRQRFDNGEDPNDPAAQQQGGFQQGGGFNHAFFHQQAQQQGQQFFQQGGFNFKFG